MSINPKYPQKKPDFTASDVFVPITLEILLSLILGIKDNYSKGGSYNFLKEKHRLVPALIVEDVIKFFKKQ